MTTDQTALQALEHELLGGARRYTRSEVAKRAGVDADVARGLWRALGFADVDDDETAFTDRDVEALATVDSLVQIGVLDDTTQFAVTRTMGQTLARLADWQVATITQALTREAPDEADPLSADDAADVAREFVPVMERLIGYVWRRHLAAIAMRQLEPGRTDGVTGAMAVGFADLVGFTSFTRHADDEELGRLVERFEQLAGDVVAQHGGRVVKTVGDEVMFTATDAPTAAEIALSLSERVAADDDLPEVRVGVACGMVLSRLGDVYGEPVNIASRLTTIARPGSVLADREVAAALEADRRWRLRRVPPRPVRGYALLHGFRLRRRDDGDD